MEEAPKMRTDTEDQEVTYIDSEGRKWIRRGECNQCGLCCAGDPTDGDVKGEVEGMCPYFRWVDGKGTCSIWGKADSVWSRGCNVWPTDVEQVRGHPYCKFRFERAK